MSSSLKSKQMKQLEDIFKRFDMNDDGILTQLELAALLRSMELKPTSNQMQVLLANMDIRFDAFIKAIIPELEKQVMINVFQLFDRDSKGYITMSEFASVMRRMGHWLSYHELSHIMKEADTNGDGVINFNEFTALMERSASEFFR